MCGIAGFFGSGDREILQRMTQRLVHRGPDDAGYEVNVEQRAFLGFRRLAILDLADGHQPMTSADKQLTIVFNGEIYNFRELRKELEDLGARFHTDHSDTEVLLHGYRRWGQDLPKHLNGMWAFAIHDRERRCVFLSRDHFGKKPLFWCQANGTFAFASELTALSEHPAVPTTLSKRALQKYFGYGYVPAPLTFFEGVSKLPAGHSMTLDLKDSSVQIERFWRYEPEPFETQPPNAEARWTEELTNLLDNATARRLVADVPVGCFLSGGIDSSLVAALAVKHVRRGQLKAFSIGFDEATFDETHYARMVANHIKVDHQIERLSVQSALDILPQIAAQWDEPIADSSALPTYLLCQYARKQVTVTLGGDGADELFAGYDPFKALRYARWYESLVPRPIHRGISMLAARMPVSHRYMSFDFRLKRMLRGLDHAANLRLPVWMAPLAPSELDEVFGEPVELEDVFSEAIETWDNCASNDPVERAIAFYTRLYLQDDILVKVDRASMLNSLEVRSPFLDRDVVDFARRLPANYKLRGGETKYILRQVAKPLLPEEILTRRKQGFALPVGQWFADEKIGSPYTVTGTRGPFWRERLNEQRQHSTDNRLYLWAEMALSNSILRSETFPHSTTRHKTETGAS